MNDPVQTPPPISTNVSNLKRKCMPMAVSSRSRITLGPASHCDVRSTNWAHNKDQLSFLMQQIKYNKVYFTSVSYLGFLPPWSMDLISYKLIRLLNIILKISGNHLQDMNKQGVSETHSTTLEACYMLKTKESVNICSLRFIFELWHTLLSEDSDKN
jgi:hypothetical protein